jgi:hypothetical protein
VQTPQTPIKILQEEFEKVRSDIIEKNGFSGSLSWVLKRDQGWSWRQAYIGEPVAVDFWNDSAKTMFLLTYSHLIPKSLKMFTKNNG